MGVQFRALGGSEEGEELGEKRTSIRFVFAKNNCLPLTVELFRQLAFFILRRKPISYGRFKRIDVYIL